MVRIIQVNIFGFIYLSIVIFYGNIELSYGLLAKCCPIDSRINNADGTMGNCVKSENATDWESYNVHISPHIPQFPQCNFNIQQIFQAPSDFSILNGCLDKSVDGQFYTFQCNDQPTTTVHKLNKCCPVNHSYDHTERLCIPNTDSILHFRELFGENIVIFEEKVPDCSDDEAFVEYYTLAHDIDFVDRSLKITTEHYPAGEILHTDKYCVESLVNTIVAEQNQRHVIVRSCRPRNICATIPCIRRCCKSDQMMVRNAITKKTECVQHPNNANFIPIFYDINFPLQPNKSQDQIHLKEYGMLHSMKCKKLRLNKYNTNDSNLLHQDGQLYVHDYSYDADSYCIENTKMANIELNTFVCQAEEKIVKFFFYPIGLVISCVFLGLTLIVYLSLPKLLNLHGKTLVCYVLSLLFAYCTLAIIQFNSDQRPSFCFEIAFVILFWFMAAFCWQTVMCVDIWLTFGSLQSSYNVRSNRQSHRRFIYFSIFAWGLPLAWTIFALVAAKYQFMPTNWNPVLGTTTCFFSSKVNWKPHFLFFIVPAGLQIIISMVLFIITATHCNRVKREIHRMQSSGSSESASKKEKFMASKTILIMNLKLFTVMGISWILEIISQHSESVIVETLFDVYNIFRGVLIFLIFVFKRRVIREFKHRVGLSSRNAGLSSTPYSRSTATMITLRDMSGSGNNRQSMYGTGKSANDLTTLNSASN